MFGLNVDSEVGFRDAIMEWVGADGDDILVMQIILVAVCIQL